MVLAVTGTRFSSRGPHQSTKRFGGSRFRASKSTEDVEIHELETEGQRLQTGRHAKFHKILSIIYYLLLVAQTLMCILEIVRLSLARLGIGLLPFTFVTLITAAAVHFTNGLGGRVVGWKYLNLAIWVALAVTNGMKVAEETKEGTGARKGSKYPVADEMTDVSVMIGVYAVLVIVEGTLMV